MRYGRGKLCDCRGKIGENEKVLDVGWMRDRRGRKVNAYVYGGVAYIPASADSSSAAQILLFALQAAIACLP